MRVKARIRPFRSQDASALAEIFYEAVHGIAAAHYTPAQIHAWAPALPNPASMLERASDGRLVLVAVDEQDRPSAYGDLEADGHIDHLFCRPVAARTGTVSTLYDHLEAAARERGLGRLYVEASEPALRFFLRKDFILLQRRDFALRGVPIHNFAMEKRLPGSG